MPRGERSPGIRGPGRVRSASVTGAANTRKIGATIDSAMCDTMCALNRTASTRQGRHTSPRRRSRARRTTTVCGRSARGCPCAASPRVRRCRARRRGRRRGARRRSGSSRTAGARTSGRAEAVRPGRPRPAWCRPGCRPESAYVTDATAIPTVAAIERSSSRGELGERAPLERLVGIADARAHGARRWAAPNAARPSRHAVLASTSVAVSACVNSGDQAHRARTPR